VLKTIGALLRSELQKHVQGRVTLERIRGKCEDKAKNERNGGSLGDILDSHPKGPQGGKTFRKNGACREIREKRLYQSAMTQVAKGGRSEWGKADEQLSEVAWGDGKEE